MIPKEQACKTLVLKSRQCNVLQDIILNELESQSEKDTLIANLIQIFSLSQRAHLCLVLR